MAAADRASSKVHLYRLAAVASVLGFPLMLVDAVRRGHPLAPNQFLHLPRLGGALAPGLRDDERRTTRHSAWIDVSQTPIVVTLGDLQDRHFSLMAFDAWGDCVASLSSRTRSGPRQHLVIVGRHWDGRLGVRGPAVRATSNVLWVLSRVSGHGGAPVDGPATPPAAPLLKRLTDGDVEVIAPATWSLAPDPVHAIDLVVHLTPEEYFHRLNVLAERHCAPFGARRLATVLDRLKRAGQALATEPRTVHEALHDGLAVGVDMIRRAVAREDAVPINHWVRAGATRELSRARGLPRAAQAWSSLGAPRAVDLLQYFCGSDSAGEPLRGGERYEIRFPPGRLPPVNAFWELTCSAPHAPPATGSQGDATASDRKPVIEADGSLRVLIQQEPPAGDSPVNWLAPPDGTFGLAMRLHWPAPEAVGSRWRMPAVERVSTFMPRSHRSLGAAWDEAKTAGSRGRRAAHVLRQTDGVPDETLFPDLGVPGRDDALLGADGRRSAAGVEHRGGGERN